MFAGGVYNTAFRELLAEQVARAEALLRKGQTLAADVPRWLQIDVALFADGGLAILDAIRRIDYNVWAQRPTVSKWRKTRLLARAVWLAWREGRPARRR